MNEKSAAAKTTAKKIITVNNQARGNYQFIELVEAGIVLTGTEVKSIRQTAPGLKESYVEVRINKKARFEAYLINMHLEPYSHGNIWNHDVRRERKLLLHSKQLERLHVALAKDGLTVIPTQMYFLNGRIKVELALGRGKKKGDKREDVKKREQKREMDRALKGKR